MTPIQNQTSTTGSSSREITRSSPDLYTHLQLRAYFFFDPTNQANNTQPQHFFSTKEYSPHLYTLFLQINDLMLSILLNESLPWRGVKNNFLDFFQHLHLINKQIVPPAFTYLSRGSFSFPSFLTRFAEKSTEEEILDCMSLINSNFFCGTSSLLCPLIRALQARFPLLNQFIGVGEREIAGSKQPVPYILFQGMSLLLKNKAERTHFTGCYSVTPISHLTDTLIDIYQQKHRRAVVVVGLPQGSDFHYSPLIIERAIDTLRILNTDSVFDSNPTFTCALYEHIQKAPCQKEIYCIRCQRQFDGNTCSIFTLSDIASAMKFWRTSPEISFIDFLQLQQRNPNQTFVWNNAEVREIDSYPAHMMRMTQSFTKTASRAHETFAHHSQLTSIQQYMEANRFAYVGDDEEELEFRQGNLATSRKLGLYIERVIRLALSLDSVVN